MIVGANRDQARLALLVRAGEIFHQSLDVADTLNNVARLAVDSSFADLCLFDLLDERSERLFVTASAHRDRTLEPTLASLSNIFYIEEFGVHPVVSVTRTGRPFFVPAMDETTMREHAASRQHLRYMRELHYRSKIVVPVTAQARIFGALTFVRTSEARSFDEGDLTFAIELGRRAGLAVANAKQFHRERYVAETLQRAFLPIRFPARKNVEFSAHYRPGSSEADIGGDWYDAFDTSDGRIVVSIGDVTGKGVDAARQMVLIRQAIRIAAFERADPVNIANVCNRLLCADHSERLASAFIGVLDSERPNELEYASAGHAPPLLRLADGRIESLEAPSPPLGAFQNAVFERHRVDVPSDGMLVLYTDGIIEIKRDVVGGARMLERVLSSDAFRHTSNPAEFVERAIGKLTPRDDIAVLVVGFGEREKRWSFEALDPRGAYAMRDEFYSELRRVTDADEDGLTTCGLIFAEIIGNAVRHAPGPIDVSLEQTAPHPVLHVIDKGPGFRYRAQLPTDLWTENGRGLFLVSQLAEDVKAERIPGLGSHIAVTLPVTVRRMQAA